MRFQVIMMVLWMGLFGPSGQHLKAQNIVWEKQWGFAPGSEQILKICPAEDGNFFAIGYSTKYRVDTMGAQHFYYILIKFDQNGDTIFMKKLNYLYRYVNFLGHKFGNIYQATLQTYLTWNTRCPVIVEFTEEGQILTSYMQPQYTNYIFGDGIRTADGGLIYPGVGIGPGTNQCAYKFNFLNELEWAYAYFAPVSTPGFGQRIEPMPNGHYLLSGWMGKRIYGFEMDSAGNEVSQKEFYQTPSNKILRTGSTLVNWRKTYLSYGDYDSSYSSIWRVKIVLKLSDSLGNKIWGGETLGNSGPIFPNRELSFVYSNFNGSINRLTRLTADSTVMWHLNLGSNSDTLKVLNDMYFFQNDTGLVAGYSYISSGNVGNQFWIAKIAGVGTAYDPSNPNDTVTVSAEERLFRPKDAPILYPNPTTERIQFKKLTKETLMAIYSATGKKLFQKAIMPDEYLDVCQLPPGAYLYHLKMGERVFTGKFWKK